MKTLVLGLGNLLLMDEGVGVHAVRRLAEGPVAGNVSYLEVGTALLDALEAISQADRLIVVDAMDGGQAPGTVYRMDLSQCESNKILGSMHGFDLTRVAALAGRSSGLHGVAYGVQPSKIDWGLELTPEVDAAVPYLIRLVQADLENQAA